jgi:23S rRNA (uridine2552-2'-O)-methyltransferase
MSGRKNPYAGADAHTRRAKAQGFPARSVFKLEEIDRRVKLLHKGQRVIDLGAAPGSWSLYAAGRVGPSGSVYAIDIQEITQAFPPHVEVLLGDALSLESEVLAKHAPYDVVLSDMAPSTSGSKVRDQAQSFELFMKAVEVAKAFGKPGSHFVGKIFMSGDFQEARKAVGAAYERSQVIRPDATRSQSSEVFVVGLGLKRPPKTEE